MVDLAVRTRIKCDVIIEAKESNNIISDENGALIIINILYEQGIINKRTYDNILKKYKIT